MQRSMLLQTF